MKLPELRLDASQSTNTTPPIVTLNGRPLRVSGRSPVIRYPFIAEVSDASDMRVMAPSFGPINRLLLGFGRRQHTVGVILDDEVSDRIALAAFGTSLNIDVCHVYPRRL